MKMKKKLVGVSVALMLVASLTPVSYTHLPETPIFLPATATLDCRMWAT